MCYRICFLGTPRTGSQYIADMTYHAISENFPEAINLHEPFVYRASDTAQINPMSAAVYALINIKKYPLDQSIIVRYFPTDHISKYIVSELSKLNFRFININRINVEYQLLSYLTARTTDVWGVTKPCKTTPVTIHPDKFTDAIWLYDIIKSYDQIMSSINVPYVTVNYETALRDLERVIGIPITLSETFIKQSPDDPYSTIINANEVRLFLHNLIKHS
jgi:hypothetical protein